MVGPSDKIRRRLTGRCSLRSTMNMHSNTSIATIKKLTHISVVALTMVLTLGAAVAVSGKPTQSKTIIATPPSLSASSFVQQSPLPTQAVVVEAPKAQGELMHEVTTVELTKPATPKYRTVKMLVTAYCPCTKCCGPNAQGITAS